MSWRRSNRRNYGNDDISNDDERDLWNDPFDFGFRFGEIDRMIERIFRNALSSGATIESTGPMVYGYSMTIGPDGKPYVREFGNVRPGGKGRIEVGAREPFVDTVVDEKENELKIIAEMPGVQKADIELEAVDKSLKITASRGARNYGTTVPLNADVDPASAKASYNNGVLEVSMKLKSPAKPKGVSIRVD